MSVALKLNVIIDMVNTDQLDGETYTSKIPGENISVDKLLEFIINESSEMCGFTDEEHADAVNKISWNVAIDSKNNTYQIENNIWDSDRMWVVNIEDVVGEIKASGIINVMTLEEKERRHAAKHFVTDGER